MTDARLRRVKSAKGRGWLPCTGAPSKACRVSRLTQAARRRAQDAHFGRFMRPIRSTAECGVEFALG